MAKDEPNVRMSLENPNMTEVSNVEIMPNIMLDIGDEVLTIQYLQSVFAKC